MRFGILLSILLCGTLHAAAPVISVTPSRTSGTAPLCVVFDATGTTDADIANPFHELEYRWNFGNASAGRWSSGANTALSKNQATGAIAAHCYEAAGTYTWRAQASDGANVAQTSGTITVTAADTTYAGTATVCIANATPTAGAGGCPSGAATPAGTTDFDAALVSCIGTTKRCLFKRGDTFTASTTGTVATAGPNTIGAYGTGPLPVVNATNVGGVINVTNAAVNDLRILDLEIVGSGASDTGTCVNFSNVAITNVAVLRVTCREIGKGFTIQSGGGPTYNHLSGSVFQENVVTNYYSASGGNAMFLRLATSAILGNTLGPSASTGEHVLRMQRGQKVAVASNTILAVGQSGKTMVTLRGDVRVTAAEDSFYVIFSDNKLTAGSVGGTNFAIGPSADSEDARIYDFVIERNWITAGAADTKTISINARTVTARNNVLLLGASGAGSVTGISIDQASGGVSPLPDAVQVLNNTIYSAGTITTRGVHVGNSNGAVTASVVRNNLCYFPSGASPTCLLDQGSGTTKTHNSTDPQTGGTNPNFIGPITAPAGFRLPTGTSYAKSAGTSVPAYSDFFHCDRVRPGAYDMGAMARPPAQCRGVAGK